MDPFVDLIRLLRPRATLWRRIDGNGRWGVAFRKRNDVLFCLVKGGECLLARPGVDPLQLVPGDFILIRTSTSFSFLSDLMVDAVDSEKAFATAKGPALKLGSGNNRPVTLHGGRFLFDTANEQLLTGLLPSVCRVRARDTSAWRVHALLLMNASESNHPSPGSDFVVERLMELVLVEILRSNTLHLNTRPTGILAGLEEPATAVALRAMHGDVAHPWTVAALAPAGSCLALHFCGAFSRDSGSGTDRVSAQLAHGDREG